jgi:hypothetical protein
VFIPTPSAVPGAVDEEQRVWMLAAGFVPYRSFPACPYSFACDVWLLSHSANTLNTIRGTVQAACPDWMESLPGRLIHGANCVGTERFFLAGIVFG